MRARSSIAGRLVGLTILFLVAGCDSDSPTEPNPPPPPPPLPQGIPEALALENLPLIRSLQDARVPNTLLVGIRGTSIRRDGRIRPQEAWTYNFLDPNATDDIRYAWEVFSDGHLVFFGALPAIGPAAGIDIEPLINFDSDEMVAVAQRNGGREYFETHPEADITISYRFFGQLVCQLQYSDLTPTSDRCELLVTFDATSGELLDSELTCL